MEGWWVGGLGAVRFSLEISFRGGWVQGFSFWEVWTSSGGLSNTGFEILRLSFPLFHYNCIGLSEKAFQRI